MAAPALRVRWLRVNSARVLVNFHANATQRKFKIKSPHLNSSVLHIHVRHWCEGWEFFLRGEGMEAKIRRTLVLGCAEETPCTSWECSQAGGQNKRHFLLWKKSYCSVLQISCIPTHVQGVYTKLTQIISRNVCMECFCVNFTHIQLTCDQLVSTCVGWPDGRLSYEFEARPKSMQVKASGWPNETQVGGKSKGCVDLRRLASPFGQVTVIRLPR